MSLDLTGYSLTYDDEFNSFQSSPDGSVGYQTTFYFGGRSLPSNGEMQYYSDSTVGVDPFSLANGALTITAAPGSNPQGLAYNSGLITTEGMFTQTYGYFEARIEAAQGAGMWNGFWMLPADKSWPPEIDIMEAFGADNGRGEGGAFQNHVNSITSNYATGGGGDWVATTGNIYTGYHTYGVNWQPDYTTFYMDGQQVYRVVTPADMNKPMYMLVQLAVGGPWVGSPTGETGQVKVDYIRAYSNNPDATAVALQTTSSPDATNTSYLHGAATGDGTVAHPGTLILRVAGDSWNGDAQFTVMVDGVRIGGIYSATASHALGQWQDLALTGNFSTSGAHTVGVNFINDGWGGTAATDRNLYVQSATVNGEVVSGATAANSAANGGSAADASAAVMMINGTATFSALGIPSETVSTAVSYALGASVRNLTLIGSSAIDGTGNSLDNTITGNSADNVIDGGAGNDTLIGGLGNDTYYVDSDLDTVTELPGQGNDTVYSSHFYVLPANVETLVLTGTADTWAVGNSIANTMYGNSGNNSLVAGSGAATMHGGLGDDIYYVNKLADQVIENPGEGFDTIFSSVSNTLPANVDALALTGTADLSAVGNDIFHFLYGNVGNNTLTAGSGVGILIGGLGNDTAIINNDSDQVVEAPNQGFDTIYSSVSYTLSNNVEAMHLTGSADLWAFGNDLSHFLYGNSGNNSLTAGAGVATMAGGIGDDLYYVNKATDTVVESAGQGFDTVFSPVSYTLSPNVEALVLTGTGNTSATGNGGANFLYGNAGDNTLNGMGGNDALYGGAGADRFVFGPGAGNDTVGDFSHAEGDRLDVTALHTSFAALAMSASGSDTVITVGDQTITLTGIVPASLVAQDFLF